MNRLEKVEETRKSVCFSQSPAASYSFIDSKQCEVSKYGVISGPYFPVFGLNTGKYRPEITPHFGNFSRSEIVVKSEIYHIMLK